MKVNTSFKLIYGLVLLTSFFAGCARLTESVKVFMGTSTQALEEAKKTQYQSQIFKKDFPTLYQQVLDLLKQRHIHIFLHSQKQRRIVAMKFQGTGDTTEVGIFFDSISRYETKIIVTSLSPTHLTLAAKIIFEGIEKQIETQKSESEVKNKGD